MYTDISHAEVDLKDRMTFRDKRSSCLSTQLSLFLSVIDLKLYMVQSHLRKLSPVIAYCHTLPRRSPSDSALKLECGAEWDCVEAAVETVPISA